MVHEIKLTRGQVALVDDEDYDKVRLISWQAIRPSKHCHTFYATGSLYDRATKKQRHVYLHRFVLDTPNGRIVDHINGNGLDCRRSNMRLVTPSENCRNSWWRRAGLEKNPNGNGRTKRQPIRHRGPSQRSTTGYRGVFFTSNRFIARLCVNGKRHYLGYFHTTEEAAEAYDRAVIQMRGPDAYTNFPRSSYSISLPVKEFSHVELASANAS
jgi:hypothetical protein